MPRLTVRNASDAPAERPKGKWHHVLDAYSQLKPGQALHITPEPDDIATVMVRGLRNIATRHKIPSVLDPDSKGVWLLKTATEQEPSEEANAPLPLANRRPVGA
jgi:hypothetical protein